MESVKRWKKMLEKNDWFSVFSMISRVSTFSAVNDREYGCEMF